MHGKRNTKNKARMEAFDIQTHPQRSPSSEDDETEPFAVTFLFTVLCTTVQWHTVFLAPKQIYDAT